MAQHPKNGKYKPKNGEYHPPAAAGAPLSPEQATRRAVAAVFANLGAIVQSMIGQAVEGSHLHAKLLFEFAGISAASLAAEPAAERPSLARLLLEARHQMAAENAAAEDERPVE